MEGQHDTIKLKKWIVNLRGKHDTYHVLQLFDVNFFGNSPKEAWKIFLLLVGKDRQYWNKLGYIAEQLEVTVKFVKEKE